MASYLKKVHSTTNVDDSSNRKNTSTDSSSDISLIPSSGSAGSAPLFGSGVTGQFAMLPLKMDESFGSDLSLQEAVQKLQGLMLENHELKNTLRENNLVMKSLQTILVDMKDKWEAEQRDTMSKFSQAKTVVLALRKDVETKKAKISSLEMELKESCSKPDFPVSVTTNQQIQSMYNELEQCKVNLSCMRKERDIQNNERDNLKIKMEQAQKKAITTNSQLEEKTEEAKNLMVDCERMENQMSQLVQQNKKLVEAKRNIEQEKKDLIKMNNEVHIQLNKLKQSLLSSQGMEPESLAALMKESFVIVEGDVDESEEATLMKYPEDHGIQDDEKQSQAKYDKEGETEHADKRDMSDLVSQLEAEKAKVLGMTHRIDQLQATLEACNQEIESKSQSLNILQEAMDGHVKNVESFHLQKEGELIKQLDALHRQLQHSMGHQSHSPENIENLKAQVMSLLHEVAESNRKQQEACTMVNRFRLKCEELEQEYTAAQDELGSLRSKDDHLIEALRSTVADTERALASQKEKNEEQNTLIEEYRIKLADVQKECATLRYKLEEVNNKGGSLTPGGSVMVTMAEKRDFDDKLGRLTAQLITAEDSLLQKQEEIQKLQQKVILLRSESDDIPYLKAQIDSYKVDFEAERHARQQDRQKFSALREELETMRLFNQNLQDQLNQLTSLHRRGNMSSGGRSVEHRDSMRSQPYPGGGYDVCDQPETQHTLEQSREAQRSSDGHGTPEGHGSASDLRYTSSPVRQPTEHGLGEMDTGRDTNVVQEYVCPKCGLTTQDIDSLTIHVDDCLKD